MRTIPAAEFKAKCLALMDEVQSTGETVVITKRGKPVVRLTPFENMAQATSRPIFGAMRGLMSITGDIVESPFLDSEWKEMENRKRPF